ncbi:MAG: hypothetical protein ACPKNR_06690 [Pleomorphochaeta sp.]
MKKRIILLFVIVSTITLFGSCVYQINLAELPSDLTGTFDINEDAGIGTVTISPTNISVVRGNRTDLDASEIKYYNSAEELDSDNLKKHSISTNYIPEQGEDPAIFQIIYSESGDTIIYEFEITDWDILVEKKVNGVQDTSFETYLTYQNDD